MQPGISTHVYLQQRLNPGLLDGLHKSGAQAIEVFAARHHFDYADRSIVRDLAAWFRSNEVAASLHQPLYSDSQWSRHTAPSLNLIGPEKSRRIDAMDEVKRAIESAEQIPFRAITLHLGLKGEPWNTRALENSLTAIEHLKAFAHALGVKILLENLQNEVTTPGHLLEILHTGHFDNVGVTLDIGHAHLSNPENNAGVDDAFEILKPRITELHLHDNRGVKDDHLWPGSGSIDWANVAKHTAALPPSTPGIVEIAHDIEETVDNIISKASEFFSNQSRFAESIANNE